ncbi:hypothetical protein NDU88_000926 [Pleurodeles waltl]|uniref:SH2 domain-containing protein n=1 Tax=Pleurodeles waltl TaxID=8319 RepID=A0AAV7VVG5_PLEWA|nr:hypothetical protein NDU88_000926 [Pleurodeles waltl]
MPGLGGPGRHADTAEPASPGTRPARASRGGVMAKWLNKYFSLGNSKTKSPPQPPRPDYKQRQAGGGGGTEPSGHQPGHHHTSPFPGGQRSHEESDLVRAYRAQKERDFEDPYSGPGSSLRKLRAMCRDYCTQEELELARRKGLTQCGGSVREASVPRGCCAASPILPPPGSPSPLYRCNSERRPLPPQQHPAPLLLLSEVKYISPKHRLIKIESCAGLGTEPTAGVVSTNCSTWSPTAVCKKQSIPEESNPAKKEKVVIADDYSDPFDAKSELKNKEGKGENAGYMEPYEAQKLMTDIKEDSLKSQKKAIQLYDTPYEPESNGVDSDSESVVSQRLRESRLPQDDERPADEYDQPWEWNKALPALAAQFNGNEKRQTSSPSPSSDRRRQLRAPGGGFKPIKHGSPELCGIFGERVDPTVALEKQIWYHGAISRTDAENLLRLCKECSYLVRNSQTSKHDYSLSLNVDDVIITYSQEYAVDAVQAERRVGGCMEINLPRKTVLKLKTECKADIRHHTHPRI